MPRPWSVWRVESSHYCSKECQTKDWPEHRRIHQLTSLPSQPTFYLPNAKALVRLARRELTKAEKEKNKDHNAPPKPEWRPKPAKKKNKGKGKW